MGLVTEVCSQSSEFGTGYEMYVLLIHYMAYVRVLVKLNTNLCICMHETLRLA